MSPEEHDVLIVNLRGGCFAEFILIRPLWVGQACDLRPPRQSTCCEKLCSTRPTLKGENRQGRSWDETSDHCSDQSPLTCKVMLWPFQAKRSRSHLIPGNADSGTCQAPCALVLELHRSAGTILPLPLISYNESLAVRLQSFFGPSASSLFWL